MSLIHRAVRSWSQLDKTHTLLYYTLSTHLTFQGPKGVSPATLRLYSSPKLKNNTEFTVHQIPELPNLSYSFNTNIILG